MVLICRCKGSNQKLSQMVVVHGSCCHYGIAMANGNGSWKDMQNTSWSSPYNTDAALMAIGSHMLSQQGAFTKRMIADGPAAVAYMIITILTASQRIS
ncbi:hypothetical protein L1987_26092 [Smallanthus sonchifolius]|uniref:Uncharacterized protein n=1 Tax=Smallanthus sonchifolius TaxID=185202 RepID=A0ACB9I8V1_9ASTR|nr:hypothetical protein L1987_26092 [Smallanthus sonchifolius]